MKYRLKDRELQEKLDAISGGDFSKKLQDPAKSEEGFAVAYGDFPEINGLRHLSIFLADEIEEVPEYDPNAWNEWPDVTPPEKVLLRAEILTERYDQNGPEPKGGRPIAKDGMELSPARAEKRDSGPKLHWRTWPDEIPKTGTVILLRVELFGLYYYVAGYLDGVDFVDSAGHPVFRDDPDDEDTVFERRTPDEFQWIPLGDLLGDLLKEGK